MKRHAFGVAVLCLALAACGGKTGTPTPATPSVVAESSIDSLLLTPDAQYIRNPVFASNRDSAWILSLRTTLTF